jgi:protein ImuA
MTCIDDLSDRPRERSECPAVTDSHPGHPANAGVGRERVVDELRRLLPRMSGVPGTQRALSFGIEEVDARLHAGGLAFGALHEVVPANDRAMPAALAFVMALLGRLPRHETLLLVSPQRWLAHYGQPHGHGLNRLGVDPSRILFAQTADDKDTLWALEESLRALALTAVVGMIERLDLKTSQKLQFTARETHQPLLLLRPAKTLEASAATTRWRVGTAEAVRDRFGLVTRWRWRLRLERCRNGRGGEWFVEFDHVAHRFSLSVPLAGHAVSGGTGAEPRQRAG